MERRCLGGVEVWRGDFIVGWGSAAVGVEELESRFGLERLRLKGFSGFYV
jgi:hypothetical protein